MCVFQVSALKKLGMVDRHNILFVKILNIEIAFSVHLPPFSSKFDILLTIHNKMLGRDKNLGRVGKPETHIFFFFGLSYVTSVVLAYLLCGKTSE